MIAEPAWLIAAALALLWSATRRSSPGASISSLSSIADLPASWRVLLRPLTTSCRYVALAAVAVALAGPSCEVATRAPDSLDVLYLVDVSPSMRGRDVEPNRLRRAQAVVADVVRARADNRVGLVLFSGSHALACPLTRDHRAFLDAVARVGVSDGQGTAIRAATSTALDLLQRIRSTSAVVVIITDGANTRDNRDVDETARQALAQAVPLVILQLGHGGPVPMPTEFGTVVVDTEHPDGSLQRLARASGGTVVDGRRDDAAQVITRALAAEEPAEPTLTHAHSDVTSIWAGIALVALCSQLALAGLLRLRP